MIGTEGKLTIQGGAMRGVQLGRLQLLVNQKPQHSEEGPVASMPDAAVNVAGIYVMLRDDVLNGMAIAPDFGHALQLSRLLNAVLISSLQALGRMHPAGRQTDGLLGISARS